MRGGGGGPEGPGGGRRRRGVGWRGGGAEPLGSRALPPAAGPRGPRDPRLIELHPLIRLSLRQLAANLKYGCLLSYLTLLPPTRCCRRTHTHTHTHKAECPIYSGAIKVGQFCYFSFALSCLVKVAIFQRLALATARSSPNSRTLASGGRHYSRVCFSSSSPPPPSHLHRSCGPTVTGQHAGIPDRDQRFCNLYFSIAT